MRPILPLFLRLNRDNSFPVKWLWDINDLSSSIWLNDSCFTRVSPASPSWSQTWLAKKGPIPRIFCRLSLTLFSEFKFVFRIYTIFYKSFVSLGIMIAFYLGLCALLSPCHRQLRATCLWHVMVLCFKSFGIIVSGGTHLLCLLLCT